MSPQNVYLSILESPNSVFSMQNLMMMTRNFNMKNLARSLNYYKKKGLIRNPRKGIYTKPIYDEKGMACSIMWPSYISMFYVLRKEGVIYQYSEEISVVSKVSRTLNIEGKTYKFYRVNPEHWITREGITEENGYAMACKERALLDVMYLFPNITYFDNLSEIDWQLVEALLPLYNNTRLNNRIKKLRDESN